jgi:hypothetical protein
MTTRGLAESTLASAMSAIDFDVLSFINTATVNNSKEQKQERSQEKGKKKERYEI